MQQGGIPQHFERPLVGIAYERDFLVLEDDRVGGQIGGESTVQLDLSCGNNEPFLLQIA